MGDWATLLPGVAAVFTALSGPAVAVYAIRRGSKRERKSAARGALDRVFGGDDDEDEDRYEAVTKLLEELHRRRKDEQ